MPWQSVLDRVTRQADAALALSRELGQRDAECRHITSQLFRAASSVGASLHEAEGAFTRREMAHRQSIALREAREVEYWLGLLLQAGADPNRVGRLRRESGEIVAILTTSVRKLKQETIHKDKGQTTKDKFGP
jgi:four helix bundle protein